MDERGVCGDEVKMADRENARLTKAQFYWRAVPTFLLMMVWTGVWGLFAGMTGGFGDIGHGYLPTLFLIHGFCIECFELSVLLMLVSLRWGIRVQWCLTIAGGVLWLASGAQDPLIVFTVILILVPVLGNWLLGLKSAMKSKDPADEPVDS